jgi:2-polyprenyl-3-methyl-5-hydroxy-6-metoxy-1,4-benzoquinol methylase
MEIKDAEKAPKTFVVKDPSLKLEKNGLIRRFFNLFFIPFLNALPKNFKYLIKKTNKSAATVIDNATNHKALEVLYSKGYGFSLSKMSGNFFRYVWFNLNNSKGVRNRLKLVKWEMKKYLESISTFDRDIEIISIAAGSSRAIIETVRDGHYLGGAKLSITFLDKSEHAIAYSKNLSTEIQHLPLKLQWINDSVGNFLRNAESKKYDIVEIVGLLDYFTDEKVVEIFAGIYKILESGGILITSNINHNSEEKFVTKVIEWPMIYRTAEELGILANQAGFKYNEMKVFYEPLKVHGMVVARK